ncbi:TetR family transcriptional regulator [Micromonospora globbae]|jgi:AcrR family transcriptional regulator|uniref:TetR family transcriptional regulator n=1 Tax=Micromonospora globbae TaxID=1894969 RepID=A0A420F6B8_9ACTN|nr:TetR family transcriptional regulator [Micromonospora globbae]RKF28476.1 TetR/AcrR family transcriptional regulator [Micromonospora globbae]
MARRTGRRPGNPGTREAILDAARAAFAERGFDAASIRAIAGTAGVDPALVHHYFGSKDQLFLAAMQAPVDPRELLPTVLAGDPGGIGERLVRTFLAVWDSPAGTAGVALLRSAVSNEWTARLLREFVVTQVLRRVLNHLDVAPAELPLRGSLVATQLIGLAMIRYVVRLEPVASAAPETLVASVGPTIQRYITGDLPPQRDSAGS